MAYFIGFVTILHGALFAWDEYILNKKRDLSRVEINSALGDGVLYLVIIILTIFTRFNQQLGYLYLGLSILSCVSIVKNELIYTGFVDKKEKTVHAALYVLHPVILFAFYQSWKENYFVTNINYWMLQLCYLALSFKAVTYNVIYWNYMHEKKN